MSERYQIFKRLIVPAMLLSFSGMLHAQITIVPGGVLNAASFDKSGAGVAPGSLITIFGTGLGATQADADTVPFSTVLGGVRVTVNGVSAALRDVIPAAGIVNAQVPFEVLPAGQATGTVDLAVAFGGGLTTQSVKIVPAAPGLFTIPSGVGNVILVNLTDFQIAAPAGSIQGLTTRPINRGENAYLYATGLGAMTPPVDDGSDGGTVTHTANSTPIVWIGGVNTGVMAPVIFAGQAGGYPGVYQVNITIPSNAPTGDKVPIQLQSADGSVTSLANVATVSIR
jgi:minor extracellular serine protease Vpr